MRWIWYALAILAAGAAFFVLRAPPAIPVHSAQVTRGEIKAYFEETAKTRVPEIYEVTMPLAGRVQPISVKEGDIVKAGQVVARMDAADLETDLRTAINEWKAQLEGLIALKNTTDAQAETVAASEAKYKFNLSTYDRKKQLFDKKTISETEFEEAELNKLTSRVEVFQERTDQFNYELFQKIAQIFLLNAEEKKVQQQRDRDRAEIKSPADGVVLDRKVINERYVAAGQVLLEVGDPQRLEVVAELLTQDAGRVELGDAAEIEGLGSGPQATKGKVTRIYPQGFTKVSSMGVEQQRVLTVIAFDEGELARLRQTGQSLGVDYRVRVKIFTDQKASALKLPRAALFRGVSGSWQAFVIRDGVARLLDVEIGLSNDFEIEVTSGLSEGDEVIIAPESGIKDGTPVSRLNGQAK